MASFDSGDMSHVPQTRSRHQYRQLDWERNHDIILNLYEAEGRPLREVHQIMQQKYGFDAS